MVLRFIFFVALFASAASQCSLCPNGKAPNIPTDTQTASICKQVIALLPTLSPEGCPGIQNGDYPRLCGCFPTPSYTCNVCPNGGTTSPFGKENTDLCNKIKFAAKFSTTKAECTTNLAPYARQVNITKACGCPGVPKPCTICPDGSSVGAPSQLIGAVNTCGAYDVYLRTLLRSNPQCESKYSSGLPIVCKCPGISSTQKPCSVCDGGAQRGVLRVPKLATYCQNADNKALFVPLDSCAQNTDNDDQWACGCPNAVADCSLCEDGTSFLTTRASDFSKRGETCAYDQFSLKYIVGVDCTAIRGTLGKTCGCSNTKSELSVCRICGTGKSLPNPNLFVPSFGHTCGFIEYYATAQANSGKKSCTFYRGEYVDVCCNGGPDPYKTNSPNETPPPNQRPTAHPITRRPTTRRPTTRRPTIRTAPSTRRTQTALAAPVKPLDNEIVESE